MKVRRRPAKVGGIEPERFRIWREVHGKPLPLSEAEYPWCECVRWMKHGDHSKVQRASDTHGMVKNCEGTLSLVSPGEHIVEDPDGNLIHHPLQDISKWYEISA